LKNYSFKKSSRILKRRDYLRLFKIGKKYRNKKFILIVHPNNLNRSRLGITVTKRVGNAAKRNRIKRFAREFFRQNIHNVVGNWDIVIIANKQATDINFDECCSSFNFIFKKIPGAFKN